MIPDPPFSLDDARALRQRLELGVAVLDEDGNEAPVPKRRQRPPRGTVPTVDELLASFGGAPRPALDPGEVRRRRELAAEQTRAEQARESARLDAQRAEVEARMLERIREREELRRSLPCYPLDPARPDEAPPSRLERSDVAAARACQSAGAYVSCLFRSTPDACPRSRIDRAYGEAVALLSGAQVPREFAERIAASLVGHRIDGRRVAPQPLDERPAVADVERWIRREPGGPPGFTGLETLLVLSGALRCGKSLAAAVALMSPPCEPGNAGRWIAAAELTQIPISDYDPRAFVAPPVLVIDDLGTEALGEWTRPRIYGVIAERHAAKRRTVITTNLDRATFDLRYDGARDGRLHRRIDEAGKWIRLAPWTPQPALVE